jgi:hypothetical protein
MPDGWKTGQYGSVSRPRPNTIGDRAPASRWGSRTGPRLEYGWGQRDTLLEDYLVIASRRLFKIMANGCHEGVDEFLMLRCATAGDLQTLAPASPVP